MFNELYDRISLMFSKRWPQAERKISAVDISAGRALDIVIVYEFSVGDDGPYTGKSASPAWFDGTDVINIHEKLPPGQTVTVRYRPDNPSINKLDASVWSDLEGL